MTLRDILGAWSGYLVYDGGKIAFLINNGDAKLVELQRPLANGVYDLDLRKIANSPELTAVPQVDAPEEFDE